MNLSKGPFKYLDGNLPYSYLYFISWIPYLLYISNQKKVAFSEGACISYEVPRGICLVDEKWTAGMFWQEAEIKSAFWNLDEIILRLSVEYGMSKFEVWGISLGLIQNHVVVRDNTTCFHWQHLLCFDVITLLFERNLPLENLTEYQIKVKAAFVVPGGLVNSGHYSFMRIFYLDDENNWRNLNHRDERRFVEVWLNANLNESI